MFSSLQHYPRQSFMLDMTDPVPQHISRYWRGYADQARSSLLRYKRCIYNMCVCACTDGNDFSGIFSFVRFNYDPSVSVPAQHYPNVEVEGRSRYRFFRRPIIPFLPQMPPSVVLAPTRLGPHPVSPSHIHSHPPLPHRVDPLAPPTDSQPHLSLDTAQVS